MYLKFMDIMFNKKKLLAMGIEWLGGEVFDLAEKG